MELSGRLYESCARSPLMKIAGRRTLFMASPERWTPCMGSLGFSEKLALLGKPEIGRQIFGQYAVQLSVIFQGPGSVKNVPMFPNGLLDNVESFQQFIRCHRKQIPIPKPAVGYCADRHWVGFIRAPKCIKFTAPDHLFSKRRRNGKMHRRIVEKEPYRKVIDPAPVVPFLLAVFANSPSSFANRRL